MADSMDDLRRRTMDVLYEAGRDAAIDGGWADAEAALSAGRPQDTWLLVVEAAVAMKDKARTPLGLRNLLVSFGASCLAVAAAMAIRERAGEGEAGRG